MIYSPCFTIPFHARCNAKGIFIILISRIRSECVRNIRYSSETCGWHVCVCAQCNFDACSMQNHHHFIISYSILATTRVYTTIWYFFRNETFSAAIHWTRTLVRLTLRFFHWWIFPKIERKVERKLNLFESIENGQSSLLLLWWSEWEWERLDLSK